MADAAVVSLIQILNDILHSHPRKYAIPNKKQEIESLLVNLRILRDFLVDSAPNRIRDAQHLETKIRDAAYKAQELIESRISEYFTWEQWIPFYFPRRNNFCRELNVVTEEIDSITQKVIGLPDTRDANDRHQTHSLPPTAPSTHASGSDDTMVDYHINIDDFVKNKERLLTQHVQLQVIPIVGMGGIDKNDGCCSTHLIDGDGTFNVVGIDKFIKEVKLADYGLSYAVVAIMGPQSSGKSALLNHLFGTNFREMDAFNGRSQTTKGIWMAHCVDIEPCTIIMDLEGTDGRERGEDDTAFEKQSALFAFAVSDIVLINMWCHDIGCEQAANKPLLKTVFQVMMRSFSRRKTTLMFVIRDKTKTPLENLETILREDIQKIWDSVPKPQAHRETPLSEFFNVEVVALSSYEEKEEQFKEQVASLRPRFFHSIAPGGLAGDRRGVVPASGFSYSAQQIWTVIKENKDLDLPTHKVMVATVRCEEIGKEKFSSFIANEEWRQLEETVQSQSVPGFGRKLTSIIDVCLLGYDAEATYFDEGVRSSKRKQLEEKLLQLVQPVYQFMLGHIRSGTLNNFKEAFDSALNEGKGFALAARDYKEDFMSQFDKEAADVEIDQANLDSSKVRDKLRHDMDAHIAAVRTTKLSELTTLYETKLNEALSGPVEALLDGASDHTWSAMRKLFQRETEVAITGFSSSLSGFEMDEVTKDIMLSRLEEYASGLVEAKAKEEARMVLILMKDRFSTLFSQDSDSMPRVWTGKEDVKAITKTARSASLKLLSVMAAIRLDDYGDAIENTLALALLEPESGASTSRNISVDPLSSSSWEKVPSSKTLLTPVQCKSLWRQFKTETEYTVTQAIAALPQGS